MKVPTNPETLIQLAALGVTLPMHWPSDAPKHQGHPTNKEWDLYDICDSRHPRPPAGASLLTINEGGVLTIGPWREGLRYWGFKPGIPKEHIPDEFYLPNY